MYRWEAPLFFANAGSFREQIRRIVRQHQPDSVVLQCEAITSRTRALPVGTSFSLVLNEPASVLVSFSQKLNARKLGHRCVAETHANANHRPCRLTRLAGRLSFAGHSATNKVSFQGRISTTKKLRPGRYNPTIIATNLAGARSAPASLSFTIVK